VKINNDQAVPSRLKKLAFDYKRGRGHFFSYLMNRFRWHYYPRLQHVSKFPDHVDIEISAICNMKCPMCYTTTDEYMNTMKKGLMEFKLFKKIIDECADHRAYSIRLSLRGEPFLHKDIIEMIRYAKKKGIKEVSTLANNLVLDPKLFKEAMEAGLDWLTISFDGLGKMYEWIRQPAKFAESYEKIKEYKRIKDAARSVKPIIKVQTVWPAIKDNAKEYFDAFESYVDNIAINTLVDYLHKDTDIVYVKDFVCPVLYQRLVIGFDGIVMLCTNDEFCTTPVGDVNTESVYDIWHGQKMTDARKAHKEHKGVELLTPCKHCYMPRKTEPVTEFIGDSRINIDKYINRPDEVGE